jgi:phosphatidylglycerol:prolipoprotein diacylglycerol transferase
MLPILQLGPLAIQVPGLVLLLGVWLGLTLAEREAARLGRAGVLGVTPQEIYNLALAGLVAGLLGARLAYVARYPGAYRAGPLGLISPSPVTLAVAEGVLIGVVAAVIYGSRRRLPLRPTLDALAPATAAMGVALAVAHLASGDAFGAPTRVGWRVFLWDDYRHPSQVYELLAAVAILAVSWARAERQSGPAGSGLNFLVVIALSAAARVLLEAFRGDSVLLAGGLRAAQVGGMAVLATCLVLARRWGGGTPPAASDRAPR